MKLMDAPLSLAGRLRRSWDINMTVCVPVLLLGSSQVILSHKTFQPHPQQGGITRMTLNHSLHH